MLKTLAERHFPCASITALASARSAGTRVPFGDDEITVKELTKDSFKGIDLAIFSAGGSVSTEFAPYAVASGCVVVDNSSAWRMDDRCPLVIPEVNPDDLEKHNGIIANPNCSTIQMLVALKPLHDAAKIKRIIVTTMQAVRAARARRASTNSKPRCAASSTCRMSNPRPTLIRSPSTACPTSTSSRPTTTPRKK